MLRYTGHPLIDVGVATITAYAKKQNPQSVTEQDLEEVADFLKDIYSNLKSMQRFISVIFMNSTFVQPSKTLEDRLQYADSVLFAFREGTPTLEDIYCVFFPELPAVMNAHRQYVPLLNGDNIGNFSPMGNSGLPISGLALLAIHAMPLGCMKCGNLMAFHQLRVTGDDGVDMTLALTRLAFQENYQSIMNMRLDPSVEMPNWGSYKKTRYIEALGTVSQTTIRRRQSLANITGYYFTNYGPKPSLEIVRLNNAVADFVQTAEQDTPTAWHQVVYLGWQQPKAKLEESDPATWRNQVYEDLFELPQKAWAFLRYLQRGHDWQLIEIFLGKVLRMDKARIDTYRLLGDRLAAYMLEFENGSSGFYYRFSREGNYGKFHRIIRSAAEKILRAGVTQPLFTYDEFILAFEHPGDSVHQWRLGRDLISIRILEVLHSQGIDLSDMPDGAGESEDDTDEDKSE